MRLEEDMKLDYKDVLIRPKRSTLGSRKEVDVERGFTFRNYKYNGHPKFENDSSAITGLYPNIFAVFDVIKVM